MTWSPADIPDLTGRRALVTGVTSGIGHYIALELARAGAEVVLGARSAGKVAATEKALLEAVPTAVLRTVMVDVASLASIRSAAEEVLALGSLDILVNNAGVMGAPTQRTADGHEIHFGTNHLGPFALTGLLLPALVASGDGRVVNTSSQSHRAARRRPEPVSTEKVRIWRPYAHSKLSVLRYTLELDRRLRQAGLPVRALAAHPGYAGTGIFHHGWMAWFGQSAEQGALPSLMAATADLPGGTHVGPSYLLQMVGPPKVVGSARKARDAVAASRLWALSEQATGVSYL